MVDTPDEFEAALDRALLPYEGVFPAAILAKMRAEMREYATTHPYPVALAEQLRAEPVVQESHDRTTGGADGVSQPAEAPLRRRIRGAPGSR